MSQNGGDHLQGVLDRLFADQQHITPAAGAGHFAAADAVFVFFPDRTQFVGGRAGKKRQLRVQTLGGSASPAGGVAGPDRLPAELRRFGQLPDGFKLQVLPDHRVVIILSRLERTQVKMFPHTTKTN